jgi:hypothetical protein
MNSAPSLDDAKSDGPGPTGVGEVGEIEIFLPRDRAGSFTSIDCWPTTPSLNHSHLGSITRLCR